MNASTSSELTASSVAIPAATAASWRKRMRMRLMLLGPIAIAVIGAWVYVSGGRYESTDDAYVQTARVDISANVPGRVVELDVHDNQVVHKGDVLFRLDDAPYRIAVEEAGAQLAVARLQIESLKANYRQRQSELASAQDTVAFHQREFDRQKRLVSSGIASQVQFDSAEHALSEARDQVLGVHQQIGAVLASLAGDPAIAADQHPTVKEAQSRLDRAELNLAYTVVKAPGDGIVTRVEQLQMGSYITAAAPVFALVSAGDVWVEANFKEDQLAHMRVGQKVSVQVDSYPGRTFTGMVASTSPGTGSQFSLLPPENATGNWVKVVQRLPVRVELDRLDSVLPLHAGLSAAVSVDTQHRRHLFGNTTVDAGSGVSTASRQ